jgi:hypothetical protein
MAVVYQNCQQPKDGNRTSQALAVLLAAAVQNPKLKVLLITRPHATDYLMMQVTDAGFDRSNMVISRQLPELNYLQHQRKLARLALGRDWASYAVELAFATRDSPLLTVLEPTIQAVFRMYFSSLPE